MKKLSRALTLLTLMVTSSVALAELPRVTGLTLEGNQLSWDAQEGATGYNIQLDYDYYDTVRGGTQYTVTEPGKYHVISFNDEGEMKSASPTSLLSTRARMLMTPYRSTAATMF